MNFYNNRGYWIGGCHTQEYSSYTFNGGYFAFNTWEEGSTIQVYQTNGVFLGSIEAETGCADCSVMGFFIDVEGEFLYVNDIRHLLLNDGAAENAVPTLRVVQDLLGRPDVEDSLDGQPHPEEPVGLDRLRRIDRARGLEPAGRRHER